MDTRKVWRVGFGWGLLALVLANTARADWVRDGATIAWRADGKIVWRFSYDTTKGKPYFHPVSVAGGPSLTNFQPADHPWHYGLWFSWKYINHTNYWEEDRRTGRAAGKTSWDTPEVDTRPDGSARIELAITYTNPAGHVDLTEQRQIEISAPAPDGSYTIDWRLHFVTGPESAVFDRTPMPGEPKGQVNGGYAGLSARLAPPPLEMAVVTTDGPIARYEHDRARPASPAVGCNFTEAARDAGAIAILSDPRNSGERAPWYIINAANGFRFADAAVLAPHPITLAPQVEWTLHYRVVVSSRQWTPETLRAAMTEWLKTLSDAVAR